MNYLPGDYVCVNSKGNSPGGRIVEAAIRYFTHSEYDHAFIAEEGGKIIEAEPHGVSYADLSKYDGLDQVGSTTFLTDAQRAGILKNARGYIGTPYNFLDIVYLGLELNGIDFPWLLRQVLTLKNMICSQVVAQCGVSAGVKEWLCDKKYAQLVTPGDLARLAAGHKS